MTERINILNTVLPKETSIENKNKTHNKTIQMTQSNNRLDEIEERYQKEKNENEKKLKEMEVKISSLQSQINENSKEIRDVHKRLSSMDNKIDEVKNKTICESEMQDMLNNVMANLQDNMITNMHETLRRTNQTNNNGHFLQSQQRFQN